MVTAKPKGKYTHSDYFSTPESERWELIDGVLYHMAVAPNIKHQTASGNLYFVMSSHIRPLRLGLLFNAPYAVILAGGSAIEPDLLFVSAARSNIVTERACEGPPDLVVEILSSSNSRHDLEIKRELYARHGVPEYLIVDSEGETVRALTGPNMGESVGMYTGEALYRSGDTLEIAAIPGLAISVADIFTSPL
jgi:Uma2 family endonuclease